MNLNEFAKEVHQNAVVHGWWGEEYTDAAVIALIHAEISEAFEEWRAGRPMVWHQCLVEDGLCVCEMEDCAHLIAKNDCAMNRQSDKPEGIATELIDVTLRVLDTATAWGIAILQDKSLNTVNDAAGNPHIIAELTLPDLVRHLHRLATSLNFYRENEESFIVSVVMSEMVLLIFAWLRAQNLDPEALLREKHEYNKTRPYRHGGKRC